MTILEQIIFDYLNEHRLYTQYDDHADSESTASHAEELAKIITDELIIEMRSFKKSTLNFKK
jgi:hypothetical protein